MDALSVLSPPSFSMDYTYFLSIRPFLSNKRIWAKWSRGGPYIVYLMPAPFSMKILSFLMHVDLFEKADQKIVNIAAIYRTWVSIFDEPNNSQKFMLEAFKMLRSVKRRRSWIGPESFFPLLRCLHFSYEHVMIRHAGYTEHAIIIVWDRWLAVRNVESTSGMKHWPIHVMLRIILILPLSVDII
jgi:hypothetical protein